MAQDNVTKLAELVGLKSSFASPPAVPRPDATLSAGSATPISVPPPLHAAATDAGHTKTSIDVSEILEPDVPARRVARRRPAGPIRSKIAANDDVPSIGGLIYSLEQKPSGKVFRVAAIASFVWAVAGLAFGLLALAPDYASGQSIGGLLLSPVTFYTATAVIVPVAIIWLLALLNWHVASLALRSSTMTEVAIRLAEPDRAAEQSIASLGQAVRRQVSFMNDAVSRALGRAGELEALVHNQVADLERSYEQNERRIRGLIQELTGERHALLNTSTGVTDTLKTLGTEIPALIEKLSTQQVTLAGIIKGAGENLSNLEGSLANQTGRFEQALGQRTHQLQSVLEDYTTAFSTALGARTEQMRLAFDSYLQTLDTSLGNRTENLQTVFEEYARALDTTLGRRAEALDSRLVERTKSLDDAFQRRLELFDEHIVRSTTAIDGAVAEKTQMLTTALDSHAATFRETISQQSIELDESVMSGISAVRRTSENITRQSLKAIEGLAGQSEMLKSVSDNLLSQIHGVTQRFENQGQTILTAANTLENANYKIDSTLQARHADLSRTLDRLSGKADEFGRVIEGYSSNLEGSLSTMEIRARALTQELHADTETRSRALLAEISRVKSDTERENERRIAELRQRFTSASGEISAEFEQLSGQLSVTQNEAKRRAAEAASILNQEQARIREESARLPAATRETADSMRRALQDQLKALDQLSQISARAVASREITKPDGAVTPQIAPPARQIATLSSALAQERSRQTSSDASAQNAEAWSLGDLLARASRDDETGGESADAAPSQAPHNMTGQTREEFRLDVALVARALDPATAANIWSRVRAGQRNVMVRSIYAPETRPVFDEISRRIPTDPALVQTIMRYLSDFERVLQDADRRDSSGRMAQSHIMSDSGRVFLFLAHASGRIA